MATHGSVPPADAASALSTSGGYAPPPPTATAAGAPAAVHWPTAPPGAGFAPPYAAPAYELGTGGPSVVVVHHMLPDGVAPSAGAPFGGPHHYHLHQQHVHSHPYHHHHYHVHDPYLQHYRQQHPYHAYHLLVQQPHVHLHQHALHGFSPQFSAAPADPAAEALPPAEAGDTPSATNSTATPSIDVSRAPAHRGKDAERSRADRVPASKQQQHKSFIHVELDPTAQLPAPPPGRSARQLIVNYLDNEATGPELMRIFGTVGAVESARVMYDARTNEPLGYGFVYMQSAEDASRAVTLLNRYPLRKKRLKVSFANPKRDNAPAPATKPRKPRAGNDDEAHPTPDPSALTGPTSGPSGSSSGPTSGGPSGSSGNGSGGSDASSTS